MVVDYQRGFYMKKFLVLFMAILAMSVLVIGCSPSVGGGNGNTYLKITTSYSYCYAVVQNGMGFPPGWSGNTYYQVNNGTWWIRWDVSNSSWTDAENMYYGYSPYTSPFYYYINAVITPNSNGNDTHYTLVLGTTSGANYFTITYNGKILSPKSITADGKQIYTNEGDIIILSSGKGTTPPDDTNMNKNKE